MRVEEEYVLQGCKSFQGLFQIYGSKEQDHCYAQRDQERFFWEDWSSQPKGILEHL